MSLFVIVICLLSERFLVHRSAYYRLSWFNKTQEQLLRSIPQPLMTANKWLPLLLPVVVILAVVWLILFLFSHWLFGLFGLAFNLIIFYQCIGPGNPFYPVTESTSKQTRSDQAAKYLAEVNRQLFAPVFWYVLTGPLGVLFYRLVSLSIKNGTSRQQAEFLTDMLEWIPARITGFLYAVAGDFQRGFSVLAELFLVAPNENSALLKTCGLQSLGYDLDKEAILPLAEKLVERALIVYLVIVGALSIMAWF